MLHAAPGSGTERLAHELLAAGWTVRTVLTPADAANTALPECGATAVESWAAYAAGKRRGCG